MNVVVSIGSTLALLASLTATPLLGSVALADSSCVDGWQQVPFDSSLAAIDAEGVASLNGAPAWIVGLSSAAAEGKRVPLIGRWTGSQWTRVKSPWSGYGVLDAVSPLDSTHAWAVGSIGSYTRWPIAARWNGSAWAAVTVPRPTGQLGVFTDLAVVNANRLWTAGGMLQNGLAKPLVMYHDASGWKFHGPTLPGLAEGGLSDITIGPGGRVWSAGWRTDANGQGRPWIIYRKSGKWVTSSLPSLDPGRGAVLDLSFVASNNAWAAGWIEKDGGGYEPLLLHWDGTSWSQVATPWATGQSIGLTAVETDSSGRLVVGGWRNDIDRGNVVAVRDSAGWHVSTTTSGTNTRSAFTDIAPISGGSIVAGYTNNLPASIMSCAGSFALVNPKTASGTIAPNSPDASNPEDSDDTEDTHDVTTTETTDAPALTTVDVADTVAYDMTSQAGLGLSTLASNLTWSGVVGDFNGDSYPDVFVNHHYEVAPQLMLNNGDGTFSESNTAWSVRDRHRCDAADIDGDQRLDLFCTIGRNKGTSVSADELTMAPGYGSGTWDSLDYGLLDGYGRGRNATFLNINGDAYPDLFVVNEASRSDAMSTSNRLYRNVGGTDFVSASAMGMDHSMGGQCVASADLDGNHFDDIVLCPTEPVGGVPFGLRVFTNNGTSFTDATDALGLTNVQASDVSLADFNGDGSLDIAVLWPSQVSVYLRTGSTYTKSYSVTTTGAEAMATGDVNGDGRPDMYVARKTSGNSGHLMLVNDGTGTSFSSMAIPQSAAGRAEDVLAIDYDGNGRTDFITFNGNNEHGPVKLTAFFPKP